MTIERFTFKPPLNVSRVPVSIKLEDALLFAKRQEVPPGHRKDITPPGYRDNYVLRTMTKGIGNAEDTVGEIEITFKKTGAKKKVDIDENMPICVIARPNVLEEGEGVRIDEVVRYIPSQGAKKEMDEETSTAVPIEFFQTVETQGFPVEIPGQMAEINFTPLEIPGFS